MPKESSNCAATDFALKHGLARVRDGKIKPASLVTTRNAGVAQRQSN